MNILVTMHDSDHKHRDGMGIAGLEVAGLVHLSDSLSNPPEAVARLVAGQDALGGLENMQVSGDASDAIVAQSGAVDPATVRLQARENREAVA